MMFDPLLQKQIVEQRQQDIVRQARQHELENVARGDRASWGRRWLALAADLLIRTGLHIKVQCDRAAQARKARLSAPVMELEWK